MITASRILAALLGILGLLISISNWRTALSPKKFFTYRHITPILGGFLLAMSMILAISKPLYSLAWMGFIIDYGSAPSILHILIANLYHHISARRKKAAKRIRQHKRSEK